MRRSRVGSVDSPVTMQLQALDHVHFVVPDLQRAKEIYGPFLRGEFVPDYGGPEMNAWGGWNSSGGDFIQPIELEKSVFGGPPMPRHGLLSVSYRVADIDDGIGEAQSAGLVVRSRVGSEDIGLGKNVVQAQLEPEPVSKLPFELVEHQLPGEYVPLTETAVHHVELGVSDLEAAVEALTPILGDEFEPERHDLERGLRSRLHRRLGLRLTVPRDANDALLPAVWQPGLSTIGFHCRALPDAVEVARRAGLKVLREVETHAGREVDFEAWAGVTLRLVEQPG